MRRIFHIGAGLAVVAGALSGTAATFTVPGSFATLQAATAAPAGSTILVAPGTYGFVSATGLSKPLYFRSTGGAGVTKISGGGTSQLLFASGNTNGLLTFDGFTFEQGRGVAGRYSPVTIFSTRAAFLNCIFQDNYGLDRAGCLTVSGGGAEVTCANSRFLRNRSDRNGGAVLIGDKHPQGFFKDCLFEGNTTRTPAGSNANEGGAIIFATGGGKIVNCTFRNNSSYYAGGAIMALTPFSQTMDTISIRGCTFEGNYTQIIPGLNNPPDEGGAIALEGNIMADISGCLFSNCTSMSAGGVSAYLANMRISDCVFDNCRGNGTDGYGIGGAVMINSYDPAVVDSPSATLWMENTIIRNCIGPAGGGIFAQGDFYHATDAAHQTRLFLNNVTIDNCRATTAGNSYGNGGGLFLSLCNLQATNLNILNCTGEGSGGGLMLMQSSTAVLRDSAIVGNSAQWNSPSILAMGSPSPTLINTIVAYNEGDATANFAALTAAPRVSRGPNGYLTYLVLPFSGTPSISPRIGNLPNRGGFAAGTVHDSEIATNTLYTLTTAQGSRTAGVQFTPRGLAGVNYGTASFLLPAIIEAEHFNATGTGIANRDNTKANTGGALRPGESVDLVADGTAGGGYAVGGIEAGEWMEYDITAPRTETIGLRFRVSSATGGGSFYAQLDGAEVTAVIPVPATGGASAWQDVAWPTVNVTKGHHVLRIIAVTPGFNLDTIRAASSGPALSVTPATHLRSAKIGRNATPQSFRISNAGGGAMNYTTSDNADWLTLSSTAGTITGQTDTITVNFASANLPVGTHTALITINGPDNASPNNAQITVTLRIRPDRFVSTDFDGDGTSDLAIYEPATGTWHIRGSSLGYLGRKVGGPGARPLNGDYDADGLADAGTYAPSTGTWRILGSSGTTTTAQYGYSGTLPGLGDFDGDRTADRSVFHPATGNWYVRGSTTPILPHQFPGTGSLPAPADYDGDGRTDVAVYQSGTWRIRLSNSGSTNRQFGYGGTLPVPADYDGDGRADLALFDPATGTFYINATTTGFTTRTLALPGARPAPGDYDGDGKADHALYQTTTGRWLIHASTDGLLTYQFGYNGTVPTAAPVTP